jgi:hypothetical protein
MAVERVLVLSGLRGSSPFADDIAALRAKLGELGAWIKSHLTAAKQAANATAKATKAGDAGTALAYAQDNAAHSVLAHNGQAQAELLNASIQALQKGNADAAQTLMQAFDAVANHSDAVPGMFAPLHQGDAFSNHTGKPRGLGGFMGSRFGAVPQAQAIRTVDGSGGGTSTYVRPGLFGIYDAAKAAGQRPPISGPYTLSPDERSAWNAEANNQRYNFGDNGVNRQQLVLHGGLPFQQVEGNIYAFYDGDSGTLTIKDQGADGLAAVASAVGTGVGAIAAIAKGVIGDTCGLLGSSAVQVAGRVATGGVVGGKLCGQAATAPPLAQPTDYTPWLIGGGLLLAVVLGTR